MKSVEIPGKEGYLGVLPGHAPLITELGIGVLELSQRVRERAILTVIDGYAEVLPDRVIVLAEVSERAEEIDVPRRRAAAERAKAEVAKTSTGDAEWHASLSGAADGPSVRLQAAAKTGSWARTFLGTWPRVYFRTASARIRRLCPHRIE